MLEEKESNMSIENAFDIDDLNFHLPDSFKGLSKEYILDKFFNEQIQKNWKPSIGDVFVGSTGNIFVISNHTHQHKSLGGDKYFFGGDLCNRFGGHFLNDTYSYVMNADGMEYFYTNDYKINKRTNPYYSKISKFRYVPYPHELKIN